DEDDSFVLAKLNTDEDPTTSSQYAIRSIPAVKLFQNGEVKDEFLGALPEAQVRKWLENALPHETKTRVDAALQLIPAAETAEAQSALEEILSVAPENGAAAIALARLIVFTDPERASALAAVATKAGADFVPESQAVRGVADLLDENPESLPEDAARQPYV